MIEQYTKKAVTIRAIQLTPATIREVYEFVHNSKVNNNTREEMDRWDDYVSYVEEEGMKILTLEGEMTASINDWVIEGISGEKYPCKPDIFEATYNKAGEFVTTGLSFGVALEACKAGAKIQRADWNGKGMWVAYQPGSEINQSQAHGGAALHRANELTEPSETISILGHFDMRSADGSIVIGWLASQTDMASNDWQILD